MKSIPLRAAGKDYPSTADFLKSLCGNAPPNGVNLTAMKKRLALLDKLEIAKGTELLLEDAEHSQLADIVRDTTFTVVKRELAQICDDVIDAKAPAKANKAA